MESKTEYAPPPRWGFSRAVFDTVKALGGASKPQIYKYLPAAITTEKKITHKRLESALTNCVNRGYLIKDKGYYRIAPMSYYIAREKKRARPKGNSHAHSRIMEPLTEQACTQERATSLTSVVIWTSVGWGAVLLVFVLGYFVGRMS